MSESRPEPVLLIHGQPGGAHDWDRVKAAVGSRAELITVARPGWTAGTRPADLAGNAAAALAALDAREIPRASVAGHSFGGAVAAWLAASHPDRVARLVLAAPAASRASLVPLDYWLAWPVAGEVLSAASLGAAALALRAAALRRRVAPLLRVEERYLE